MASWEQPSKLKRRGVRRRMGARWPAPLGRFAVPVLLAVGGCGGQASHSVEHHVSGTLVVQAEGPVGYDQGDPRLRRVERELQELMGRPLPLHFKTEHMPRDERFMDRVLDQHIGRVSKVLAAFKEAHGDEFEHYTEGLRSIEFDYDGSADTASSQLEGDRLRIVLNGSAFPKELLQRPLQELRARWVGERYLSLEPEQVAPQVWGRYLEALKTHGQAYFAPQVLPPPEQREPSSGRSAVLLRMLQLAQLVPAEQAELHGALQQALLRGAQYLSDAYQARPRLLQEVGADAPIALVKGPFLRWAQAVLVDGSAEVRLELVRLLTAGTARRSGGSRAPGVFPGFDYFEFGLGLMDAWVEQGYPNDAFDRDDDPQRELYDFVLCPAQIEHLTPLGYRLRQSRHCRRGFYAHALEQATRRSALFDKLIASSSERLRRDVGINLIRLAKSSPRGSAPQRAQAVLELWRGLTGKPQAWRAFLELLAVEARRSTDVREALYEEAAALWRSRPTERGHVLFLMARIDGHGRTMVNWEQFAQTYGAPVTRSVFAAYMNHGFLAFEELKDVWPALGAGWSALDVVLPHVPSYIESPEVAAKRGYRYAPLRALGRKLSASGDQAGVARLRQQLEAHVRANPKRERALRDLLRQLSR